MAKKQRTETTEEKICPVCGKEYDKTSFVSEDVMNYKVYIHVGSKCKTPHGNIVTQRYIAKTGILSTNVDSDLIEGVFSRYCKTVQVIDTTDYDFYFPEAGLAVKRYSIDDFYSGMVKRGAEDSEIVEKARAMKRAFPLVSILVSGSPSVHASEVLDIVSTDINIKIRQIIGFTASIQASEDVDARFWENDAHLSYWAIKYAASLAKKLKV